MIPIDEISVQQNLFIKYFVWKKDFFYFTLCIIKKM
jgi:hypothetical protein